MPGKGICIDWSAGAGAQLEIFSPETGAAPNAPAANYRLRYIPPFRATIRPPHTALQFGEPELKNILSELDELAQRVSGVAARGRNDAARANLIADRDARAEQTGQMLFDSVIPRFAAGDLRSPRLFIDFGVDEVLVAYPWELMHDGEQYLCLKHYVGRFVNSNTPLAGNVQPPSATSSSLVDKLSILLISVPKPDDRINPAETFSYLPGAEEETTKILEALKGVDGVEVSLLAKKDATYANVFKALKTGRYHIVHYAGHAIFNTARPNLSALVLNDRNMATGSVCTYFGANPPLLCFMNACDSGKSDQWTQNYNIFGLAQALLATGSYLIGSRWNLEDEPAVGFAVEFYTQLVKNGMPIGEALMQARTKTKSDWKDSFTWASYVFYGDPRVYFRRATP